MVATRAVVLSIAAVSLLCHVDAKDRTNHYDRYCLFTWESDKNELCFALVRYEQRDNFVRKWFPKRLGKCGKANLRSALEDLPKGSVVMWEDWPRRGFNYPSATEMDYIKQFGKSEGVQVIFAPLLQ